MSLIPGFVDRLKNHSNHPAFAIGGDSFSYRDLAGRVARARDFLVSENPVRGAEAGSSLVEISTKNSVEFAVWYLACVSTGNVLVLVDPDLPLQRRTKALRPLQPVLKSFSTTLHDEIPESFPDAIPAGSYANAEFLIGLTSGSTGSPKAFLRKQLSWVRSFEHSALEFGSHAGQRVYAPGPLTHGLSFFAMAEVLFQGATFYSSHKFDASECLEVIATQAIDTLVVVPTMLERLVQQLELTGSVDDGGELDSLQRIICAGAKLSPDLSARSLGLLPGVELSEYYGASELSFVSVSHSSENPPPLSVGRAFSGVDLKVEPMGLQSGNSESAPPLSDTSTQAGKIVVNSEMLATGYVESRSSAGFLSLPLSSPAAGSSAHKGVGDIGYIDDDGYLYLLDRQDRMVTVGGLNVFQNAVEEVIRVIPGIRDAAVLNVPDQDYGAQLMLAVCPQIESRLTLAELYTHCCTKLQRHELPKLVWQVIDMPLTSSGKIAYALLTEKIASSGEPKGMALTAESTLELNELPMLNHD